MQSGIKECNNIDRVGFARLQEIFHYISILSEAGFEWQARRLRNHYHLAIKKGHFTAERSEADSSKGVDEVLIEEIVSERRSDSSGPAGPDRERRSERTSTKSSSSSSSSSWRL